MKPVALVERAIRNSSKSRDIVLDPFGGSGSTLIACEKTGRQARLVELDPKYCDVIVQRWQDCTGKAAVLESDGRASTRSWARGRRPNAGRVAALLPGGAITRPDLASRADGSEREPSARSIVPDRTKTMPLQGPGLCQRVRGPLFRPARLFWRSHARPGQRRRFGLWPEIGAIHGLVQKSVISRTISFAMAVCWRRSSAVQKSRTAFAQLLAALNHRLSQGFGHVRLPRSSA